jgi:pimeloyl-ACP methyl ester carboxylesterase
MTLPGQDYTEGILQVDGVSIRFFTAGPLEGTLSNGVIRTPLVLVHGTGGSTAGHFGFLFPLLARIQTVVSIDLAPPHGEGEITVADLERQVAAVVAHAIPSGPISMLGYSLGAVLAASYAAHNPDRVRNLVLVAGWMTTDAQQILRQDVQRALRGGDPRTFAQLGTLLAFGVPFLSKRSPAELASLAPPPTGTPAFLARLAELNGRIDISAEVAMIQATTLVIGCTYDLMVPRHHSLALFGAIDDARYLELAAGHAVVFERPAELHHEVRTFLAEPERHFAGSVLEAAQP